MPTRIKRVKGQLAGTATVVYQAPTGGTERGAIIQSIRLWNSDTAQRWGKLGESNVADANMIKRVDLPAGEAYQDSDPVNLEPNQALVGSSDVAAKVTYYISLIEFY